MNVSSKSKAPVGFYTGRIGPKSRRILWEEYKKMGLPLLYESDAYNDDLPYWVNVEGEGHLIIPYTLDQNDMKFCVAPGLGGPHVFLTYLKNAFNTLYSEGKDPDFPSPKFMSVGLHCRLIGKPGRIAALKEFLEYIQGFKDVWVCTREEVAVHWRKTFPFKKAS
jgi:allantoinase